MDSSIRHTEKAWIAVGDEANWEQGLENGIWGLRSQLKVKLQKPFLDFLQKPLGLMSILKP
jgi:hypothetical protein